MAKIIFNPDVAKRLVEAGTPRKGKSVQTFRRNIDSPQDSEDIRLARLQSAWTQNAAGIFTAQACFIVNDVPDTSFLFTVWAPVSTENPGGISGETRFYVIWKGRWELLTQQEGQWENLTVVTDITQTPYPTTVFTGFTVNQGRLVGNTGSVTAYSVDKTTITRDFRTNTQ